MHLSHLDTSLNVRRARNRALGIRNHSTSSLLWNHRPLKCYHLLHVTTTLTLPADKQNAWLTQTSQAREPYLLNILRTVALNITDGLSRVTPGSCRVALTWRWPVGCSFAMQIWYVYVRSEVLMAVNIHIVVMWVITLCVLVGGCRRFRETYSLKMKAAYSSEMLVPAFQTTPCHN
jgi:hypothetical protein